VDCVVVATQKILKEVPDLVISGINAGQNMGEDVLYSGTVAAALEASLLGCKAIAVSINSYQGQNFDTAAGWMVKLLEMGVDTIIPERGILNINFPNVVSSEIKGVRLTNTGHRKYYNFIKVIEELEDGFVYRIGGGKSRREQMPRPSPITSFLSLRWEPALLLATLFPASWNGWRPTPCSGLRMPDAV